MRALLVALLFAGGCQPDDLCGSSKFTCVTIHVNGKTDAPFDRLQVDSSYTLSGTSGSRTYVHRSTIFNLDADAGTISLPAEFPIVFTNPDSQLDSGGNVVILAIDGSSPLRPPVGVGHQRISSYPGLKRGDHGQLTVTLGTIMKDVDNCFHPTKCGGDTCPACARGARCSSSSDCADSTCAYLSGASSEICM